MQDVIRLLKAERVTLTPTISLQLLVRAFAHGPASDADGDHVLVVLHLQVHRVPGHLFLRAEEEEQQRVHPARPPPRPHAALRVGGLPVSTHQQ